MNFDRFRTQVAIELELGCSDLSKWTSYNQAFTNFEIDEDRKQILLQELKDDALDLYFKGVHSISNAIFNISEGNHSWSVVKFYYSIFYLMRCSLATRNLAFIKNKGIYSLKMQLGQKPIKRDTGNFKGESVRGDHKTTIKAYVDIVGQQDILQTNTINGMLVYEWMMELRNQVNYQERLFHEPHLKHFPESLFNYDLIKGQIEMYLSDDTLVYCFDETHCCIAAPIKLLSIVKDELTNFYPRCALEEDKVEAIDKMLEKTKLPTSAYFNRLYNF
jgi:hypothetical protein